MRTPGNDLYELVASMTKHEKIALKVYLESKSVGEFYAYFFDIINSLESYDEVEVKRRLEVRFPVKNFASQKLTMKVRILDSLIDHNKSQSPHAEVARKAAWIQVLLEKGLNQQARRLIDKVEQAAREIFDHQTVLEVLKSRRRLLQAHPRKDSKELIQQSIEASRTMLQSFGCETELQLLYEQVLLWSRHSYTKKAGSHIVEFEQLLQNPVLQDESRLDTFHSKRLFNIIWATYYRVVNQPSIALNYRKKIVNIWEEHPKFIEDNPSGYVKSLGNLGNNSLTNRPVDEKLFQDCYAKITTIQPQSFAQSAELFQNITHLDLLFALNAPSGNPRDLIDKIPEIREGMQKYASKINNSRIFTIHFNITCIYFILGRFQQALESLRYIEQLHKSTARLDIQLFSLIWRSVIFIELGDDDVLESEIRKAYNRLHRDAKLLDHEKTILLSLKKLLSVPPGAEAEAVFTPLYNLLCEKFAHPESEHFTGLRELITWLESHLQKRPIFEIFREKSGQA